MNWRGPLLLIAALAQLVVPAWLIVREEETLNHGKTYRFKTAPVDPVDALRGRFVALSFAVARIGDGRIVDPDLSADMKKGEPNRGYPAYAWLAEDAEGYATITAIRRVPAPPEENCLPVTVTQNGTWIDFSFDRYYLEESKAPKAQTLYQQAQDLRLHKKPPTSETYALISLWHGHVALKELYVNGLPIRDAVQQKDSAPESPGSD